MVCLESVRAYQPLNGCILIRLEAENSKKNTDIKINIKINIDRNEKDLERGGD